MALADRINQQPTTPLPGPRCSVGVLIEQLDGEELDALNTMLGTPERRGWTEGQIYDALTAEGYQVGRQTINRHRGGRCGCTKAAA